jgi:hypothetical protein
MRYNLLRQQKMRKTFSDSHRLKKGDKEIASWLLATEKESL